MKLSGYNNVTFFISARRRNSIERNASFIIVDTSLLFSSCALGKRNINVSFSVPFEHQAFGLSARDAR